MFFLSLATFGAQVGGTQIRRALIRYIIIFLVSFRKCCWEVYSPCVEIFAPVKSATNIVSQPTYERNTTWASLPPITSVKCWDSDSRVDSQRIK